MQYIVQLLDTNIHITENLLDVLARVMEHQETMRILPQSSEQVLDFFLKLLLRHNFALAPLIILQSND